MNYSIFFPTDLEEIDDANDNIDVCIRLESGETYTVVVVTPDNLATLMKNNQTPFILPDFKFLVVERITSDCINQLVEKLIEDSSLLQLYGGDNNS